MTAPAQPPSAESAWYVAHTRPRCEKKLAEFCEREGFEVTLPLFKSVKKYPGKVVTFEKPLFPNYVFLRLLPHQRKKVYQSDYVANLLDIPDQLTFQEQLGVGTVGQPGARIDEAATGVMTGVAMQAIRQRANAQ